MKYLGFISWIALISLGLPVHAQLAQPPVQQSLAREQTQAQIQALLRVLKTVRDYPPGDRRLQPGQWFVDVAPGSQIDRDARLLVGQGVLEGEYDSKTNTWRLRPKDYATRQEMIGLVASVDKLLKMMIVTSVKPAQPGSTGPAGETGEPGEKGDKGEPGTEGRPGRTGAQGVPGRIPDLSGLFDAQERMITLFEEFYNEWKTAMRKTRYVLHKYEPSQPVPQATPQYIYKKTFFDHLTQVGSLLLPWLAARAIRPSPVTIAQIGGGGTGGSVGPITNTNTNLNDIINTLNALAQSLSNNSLGATLNGGTTNVGTSGQQTGIQ